VADVSSSFFFSDPWIRSRAACRSLDPASAEGAGAGAAAAVDADDFFTDERSIGFPSLSYEGMLEKRELLLPIRAHHRKSKGETHRDHKCLLGAGRWNGNGGGSWQGSLELL
jgi:hypothetical protein